MAYNVITCNILEIELCKFQINVIACGCRGTLNLDSTEVNTTSAYGF